MTEARVMGAFLVALVVAAVAAVLAGVVPTVGEETPLLAVLMQPGVRSGDGRTILEENPVGSAADIEGKLREAKDAVRAVEAGAASQGADPEASSAAP